MIPFEAWTKTVYPAGPSRHVPGSVPFTSIPPPISVVSVVPDVLVEFLDRSGRTLRMDNGVGVTNIFRANKEKRPRETQYTQEFYGQSWVLDSTGLTLNQGELFFSGLPCYNPQVGTLGSDDWSSQ